ncbi:MAG: YggS family pyridoxal phosphate-dependent enzyme [Bdellovibrionaceae bacterium]|nr:YggS family pyridoxal phosphate-dependent enzyme [Pseudobdellovibrionaceae bacterium]
MSVAESLKKIEERIQAACARSGRIRASVRLLAVSKLQPPEKIREAYALGLRDFAENYAQEALDKQELLIGLSEARWHFIGRIQSNKAKMIAGRFALVHSVDSVKIADFFNRQPLSEPQDILLQFNVANEASKGGAGESALFELASLAVQHANIRVRGLMVMPPLTADAEAARPFFKRAREVLRELRDKLGPEVLTRHPLNELSMGTTQDFEVAIEEGATWIRLGESVFGVRSERKN